jgi:UDP-N-acetylmuramoyl-tripeptide--D-alanyl-D-alanine ligase
VSAGLDAGDVRPTRWGIDGEGLGWIEIDGVTVRPPLRGAHNLRNAMLALAAAAECGVSMIDAARGIEQMPVPPMRLALQALGSATLINDAYNANPGSTRAALELLAHAGAGRQRVAILGTMRELGRHSARLHEEIAREALRSSIDLVAGCGEFAGALEAVGAGDERIVTAPDVDELWTRLAPRLKRDALILLKASRGVRLERLVPHLTTWAYR